MHVPPRIGRYRVLEFLGEGAMGIVYRGRDDSLERDVALKVMSRGHGADKESRERFHREARAAGRLQHPNIITIYDLGEHEGAPFMAMELLEGLDLQRAIEGGLRPDPKVTLPIVLQVLAGLDHAHENGIVHRDVKPSNIFLPRKRPAKIMDFGVARLAGGLSTAGMVVGTPNYMSPEQVRGGPGIDGRSDLFSTGLILYELVTGEKAYTADSVVALMYKIAHEAPVLSLIPREPEWERLHGVLARALARDPDQRYPGARAMALDLAAALRDFGGGEEWATASDIGVMVRVTPRSSPAPSLDARAEAAGPASVAAPAFEPPSPPASGWRSRIAIASALGGGVAALLVFGLTSLRHTPPVHGPATAPAATTLAAHATHSALTAPPSPTAVVVSPPPAASSAPAPSAAEAGPATVGPVTVAPPATVAVPPASVVVPPATPAEARLDRANDLMEKGRYAEALAEARAVLAREPGNAAAQALAGDAEAALLIETCIRKANEALKKGDKDAALEEIKKGLAVNPSEGRLLALWKEATQ